MQKLRVGSCKAMSQLLEIYELANTSYQLIFIYQPFPPPNQQPFLHQNHQLPSAENPHFPLFAQFRPLSHLIIWQFQTKVVILQQPSRKCHYDRENNLQNVSKQAEQDNLTEKENLSRDRHTIRSTLQRSRKSTENNETRNKTTRKEFKI